MESELGKSSMIKPVILAGGTGTRLWPSSRSAHPKQFLAFDSSFTMLQETFSRLDNLDTDQALTICNEEHRFLAAEQLRQIGASSSLMLEPVGRNTAPAIALAAFSCLAEGDALLLVLSADHVIKNSAAFSKAVSDALPLASSGSLVTFGVVPTVAHTGYGYVRKGDRQGSAFNVDKFVEKPAQDLAEEYIESGDYLWNSGIFLFKASRYLSELKKYRLDIYDACFKAVQGISIDNDFLRVNKSAFEHCPSESIDYAVMERTDFSVVLPIDVGWTDAGSWSSLWEIGSKDDRGNVLHGDVLLHDSNSSYIRSDDKLVAVVGVDDLVVISTKDSVLVAAKDCSSGIKEIVDRLKQDARDEWQFHREIFRPWGKFDCLSADVGYQVKLLEVKPGAKLSVQMHHHRSEHWVVVAGLARVHYGEESFILNVNESTYHGKEVVHALENVGDVPLKLIEVQVGNYLGEDDIVRFGDVYGRVPK